MGHNHSHGNLLRIRIALALTALFMLVEIAGGILSGSLALLADAGHMLTDTMALALAAVAFQVSARPADSRRSYGYHRFQILAAFVNGLSLIVVVGWILFEAVQRFLSPGEIAGPMMLGVAVAGLVINAIVFVVLHGGDRDNMNMQGAVLHVVSDMLGSIAAIIAALVVIYSGWTPIDPLLSVVVALLIFRAAWQLVRRSGHILLEGAPDWLDVARLKNRISTAVPDVQSIHHVHAWGLTQQYPMLTMHVAVGENHPDPCKVVRDIKQLLRAEFAIDHSTIEVETDICADD
jgi:cobalt-zinc-cadmium efflux system protein